MDNDELMHYGVPGMKWGVRRTRSKEVRGLRRGSNNIETSKDRSEKIRDKTKKILIGAFGAATVASAAYYVSKHPEQISRVKSMAKNVKVKDISSKAINKGKTFVKNSVKNFAKGVKDGIDEGIKEAPKKAAKAVVTGIVLNQAKRALDKAVGKEEATRIFQANDNKKIGKFWKVIDDKDGD